MMKPIVPVVLLSLHLSSFAQIAQEKMAPVVFLENGKQINLAEASGEWTVAGDFMEAEGAGSFVFEAIRKGARICFLIDGKTWTNIKTLENDPNGWYCYIAMDFEGDHVILGHCAGDRRKGGLNLTQITRFPVEWLYEPEPNPEEGLVSIRKKLKLGDAVKVVCFGDSVTGLYYHTGGKRTYTDMLGIALGQIYPKTNVEMINAGVSGHTTVNALARFDKDVLAHKPDLVTVMFGLNDMVKVPLEEYEKNLRTIADKIRATGATVVFCTPNAVKGTEARPIEKLVKYCDAVRWVAAEKNIPLCDSHAEFEKLRAANPEDWRLTLSDEIHPNMGGHKEIAMQLAQTISGKTTSLKEIGPPEPALSKAIEVLSAKQPLTILAMPPYDKLIEPALKKAFPDAELEIATWEVKGKSLAELKKQASQMVRKMKPHLVLLTVPRSATASDREDFIYSTYWMANFSLSFGKAEWDCVVVHPTVNDPKPAENDALIRKLTANHDLHLIDRVEGDERSASEIVSDWVVKHR